MINLESNHQESRDLALLHIIQDDPDVSQATLAENLGVAIGTVNWHLQRLVEKGFVKVNRANRRKLRYIITPEGISLRAKLTVAYVQQSFSLFRQVRQQVLTHLQQLSTAGIHAVRLVGDGDVADVCRLTCMEQHFKLTDNLDAPTLVVDGLDVHLEWTQQTEPENTR